MLQPRTRRLPTDATQKSQRWLTRTMTSIQLWQENPDSNLRSHELAGDLSGLANHLVQGVWTKTDIVKAKTSLLTVGETLLMKPQVRAHVPRLANHMTHLLWLHDWWRDWAHDPRYQHALAHVLLQAHDNQYAGQLSLGACGVAQLWCLTGQPAPSLLGWWQRTTDAVNRLVLHLTPRQIPAYTAEQVASALLGTSWVALYGDLLDDPVQLTQHIREVRPPFAWSVHNPPPAMDSRSLPPDLTL